MNEVDCVVKCKNKTHTLVCRKEVFMNDKNREAFFGNDDDEVAMLTITDEDGVESDAVIIASFEVSELGKEYIVVLPTEQEAEDLENGQSQVMILEYIEDENGEADFIAIEDDEEMQIVVEQFEQLVETGVLEMQFEEE